MSDAEMRGPEQAAEQGMGPYRERAHLIALVSAMFPSVIAYSDPTEPEWPVITVHTPSGQMTWHLAAGDLELFPHVPQVAADDPNAVWDGHTTAEKYQRLARITGRIAGAIAFWPTPAPAS